MTSRPGSDHYCDGKTCTEMTCNAEDLERIGGEHKDESGSSKSEEWVARCKVCGGLYKYVRHSVYETRNFDCDEGWWDILDRYFKVEESYGDSIPLSYEEALNYGYQGPLPVYTSERCNEPPSATGLTCNPRDVVTLRWLGGNGPRILKCRKCGQFYKEYHEGAPNSGIYRAYKPGEAQFPVEEALQYGWRG